MLTAPCFRMTAAAHCCFFLSHPVAGKDNRPRPDEEKGAFSRNVPCLPSSQWLRASSDVAKKGSEGSSSLLGHALELGQHVRRQSPRRCYETRFGEEPTRRSQAGQTGEQLPHALRIGFVCR